MKTPIVLAAFGTTRSAMKTYSFIDDICKQRFPDHLIYWAFSSRIVKDLSHHSSNIKHPYQILNQLYSKGYKWAVVQSLHLMCGHEFYRLIDEVNNCDIRTSMGPPLLNEPKDYEAAVAALNKAFPKADGEAVIMVGHGTDHPSWCSYVALDHIFRKQAGSGIYVGVVEHGYPDMDTVISQVKKDGFRRVRLIPFLLVAGMHFEEDMCGDQNSWKQAFEDQGIFVSLEAQGLGFQREIINLYCDHIQEALDVIP